MDTFTLGSDYPSALSPPLPNGGKGEWGWGWLDCFQFGVLLFFFHQTGPSLDEQELTNSLKSPREDEQCYAAYVRSSKGVGGQLPGVVTEIERENQLKVDGRGRGHPRYKFQLRPEDNNS